MFKKDYKSTPRTLSLAFFSLEYENDNVEYNYMRIRLSLFLPLRKKRVFVSKTAKLVDRPIGRLIPTTHCMQVRSGEERLSRSSVLRPIGLTSPMPSGASQFPLLLCSSRARSCDNARPDRAKLPSQHFDVFPSTQPYLQCPPIGRSSLLSILTFLLLRNLIFTPIHLLEAHIINISNTGLQARSFGNKGEW